MNLNQMAFRCPDAQVVDTVRLEGYRLAFRMNGGGHGVATILPEPGSFVDGVLWRISERDEQSLDHYEGFPRLYRKEPVTVVDPDGLKREVMTYTMNSPYKDAPALPSQSYLSGILHDLKADGITIVIVTHDIEFAAVNADRCALFFDGEITSVDTPAAFFSGNNFYTTAANRIARHLYTNAVTCEDVAKLCRLNSAVRKPESGVVHE